MILIIVPTLNRPGKLRALTENARDATEADNRVLFVVEADDEASYAETTLLCDEGLASLVVNNRTHCWAGAVNAGYAAAVDSGIPFTHVFAGADDVLFHQGWDVPALAMFTVRPELRVAAVNDTHRDPLKENGSSHYFFSRRYIDETGGVADQPPGIVQCEAYMHGYTDTEFLETAHARGVWAPCPDSIVEHCHPEFGMGKWDDGYSKNERYEADGLATFVSRRHLWANP